MSFKGYIKKNFFFKPTSSKDKLIPGLLETALCTFADLHQCLDKTSEHGRAMKNENLYLNISVFEGREESSLLQTYINIYKHVKTPALFLECMSALLR